TQFFLKIFFLEPRILLHLPKAGEQADSLDHFLLLQRHNRPCPCGGSSSSSPASSASASRRARCSATRSARSSPKVRHATHRHHGNSGGSLSAGGVRTFGRSNQLQKFLRIIQPLLELWTECLRGDLRRDADVAG